MERRVVDHVGVLSLAGCSALEGLGVTTPTATRNYRDAVANQTR